MSVVGHGQRIDLVTIEGAVDTTGPSGFPVELFTVRPPSVFMSQAAAAPGQERLDAAQLVGRVVTEWRMPYRPDMDPDLVDVKKTRRLKYNGRTFDIVDARNVGRRVQILLTTIETVTG